MSHSLTESVYHFYLPTPPPMTPPRDPGLAEEGTMPVVSLVAVPGGTGGKKIHNNNSNLGDKNIIK